MGKLLRNIRKSVVSAIPRITKRRFVAKKINDKIALGVILWSLGAVAGADDKFLPEEDKKIKEILSSRTNIRKQDFPVVLAAIKHAGVNKINVYKFINEMSDKLAYKTKISILENLINLACADRHFHTKELTMIKDIAKLLNIRKKDFNKFKLVCT